MGEAGGEHGQRLVGMTAAQCPVRQRGGGKFGAFGMVRQIDADADGQPAGAARSSRMPASFLPSASTSLGHLTVMARLRREMRRHVGRRQRGGKGQLRRLRLRRVGPQQQGGGEIAAAGCPRRGRGGRGPRSGARRVIQSGPASPASARRRASSLVESSSA